MEKLASQNWWFFIRFVDFTSNLVYSVVWNQSVLPTSSPRIYMRRLTQRGNKFLLLEDIIQYISDDKEEPFPEAYKGGPRR